MKLLIVLFVVCAAVMAGCSNDREEREIPYADLMPGTEAFMEACTEEFREIEKPCPYTRQEYSDEKWHEAVCHQSYIGDCLWREAERYVCAGHPDAGKVPTVLRRVFIDGPDDFKLRSTPGSHWGCEHLPIVSAVP